MCVLHWTKVKENRVFLSPANHFWIWKAQKCCRGWVLLLVSTKECGGAKMQHPVGGGSQPGRLSASSATPRQDNEPHWLSSTGKADTQQTVCIFFFRVELEFEFLNTKARLSSVMISRCHLVFNLSANGFLFC